MNSGKGETTIATKTAPVLNSMYSNNAIDTFLCPYIRSSPISDSWIEKTFHSSLKILMTFKPSIDLFPRPPAKTFTTGLNFTVPESTKVNVLLKLFHPISP